MKLLKIVEIKSEGVVFEDGSELYSYHESDCCENHYLYFEDLSLEDFKDMLFDPMSDSFVEEIKDYGIALKPVNNFSIRIPGYGSNNGYYSSNLSLRYDSSNGDRIWEKDISECQVII